MKNITKKSVIDDFATLGELSHRYQEAIWENQEAQPAHFDNQSKDVRLIMSQIKVGLSIALTGLEWLTQMDIIED